MDTYALDVVVTRGNIVESRHRVHAAVVHAAKGLIGAARDPHLVAPWRSCAKPFQVMPALSAGTFEELGWGADEIALACASHGGEPEHVAIAESMLRDLGLEEGDLACGAHEPLSKRGTRLLREAGAAPTRLHNNCSGKHAAMLACAQTAGWPTEGYERDGHPVQTACLGTIAEWSATDPGKILTAVDGCGVVVFSLPLDRMAYAYARLAAATRRGDSIPCSVVQAMTTRPFLVGGTERFDTLLLEESSGGVIPKIGAEGIHTAAILDADIGVVVKAEDGAPRAQYPALLFLLQQLGALPQSLPSRLQDYARTRVRSTRGEVVGDVHVEAA